MAKSSPTVPPHCQVEEQSCPNSTWTTNSAVPSVNKINWRAAMLEKRTASKRNAKLKKPATQREKSENLLNTYEQELLELEKGSQQCANAVDQREVK